MGHSAGAQIATLLATDDRVLAAQGFGKRDLACVIGLAGPYDFLPLRNETRKRIFPASYRAASQPINFARGDEPPILLAVGDFVAVKRYPCIGHALLAGALGGRSGRSRRCWMMWRHLSRSTDARRVSRLAYGPPRITPGVRLTEP